MWFLVLVALYALNVFATRWLNKIAYLRTKDNDDEGTRCDIIPVTWFIPIFSFIILIAIIIFHSNNNRVGNWFNGKDW